MHEEIGRLELEREALWRQLQNFAERSGYPDLTKWLVDEERGYQRSLAKMNDAHKRLGEQVATNISDPEELREHVKYTLELSNLARIEADLHRTYLEKAIARLKAKKQELGI